MTAGRAEAVVIGASAGAVEALSAILPALPAQFHLPVIVVVHLAPRKTSLLAELFRAKCRLDVKEVEDKEPIVAGTVYFATPDYHLLIEPDKSLSLSCEGPVLFSRPSIDVLFETAADAYGAGLIAIILSGANHDGAAGLRSVATAGGTTIVQDPADALAATMPEAARALCPEARVLPLHAIATFLREA